MRPALACALPIRIGILYRVSKYKNIIAYESRELRLNEMHTRPSPRPQRVHVTRHSNTSLGARSRFGVWVMGKRACPRTQHAGYDRPQGQAARRCPPPCRSEDIATRDRPPHSRHTSAPLAVPSPPTSPLHTAHTHKTGRSVRSLSQLLLARRERPLSRRPAPAAACLYCAGARLKSQACSSASGWTR